MADHRGRSTKLTTGSGLQTRSKPNHDDVEQRWQSELSYRPRRAAYECARLANNFARLRHTAALKEIQPTGANDSQSRDLNTHFEEQENGWTLSSALVSLVLYT